MLKLGVIVKRPSVSVEATKDVDDMYFRKGQLNVLAHVINLETAVNNAFEDQSKEQEEDD